MSYLGAPLSSHEMDWGTPPAFIKWLEDREGIKFDFDVCASKENAKAPNYYTLVDNALSKHWSFDVGWMNPPYGTTIPKFLQKAVDSIDYYGELWVLIPARTDTKYFHDLIVPYAERIIFLGGRLHFESPHASASDKACATFGSMLVLFRRKFPKPIAEVEFAKLPKEARGMK